MIKYSCMTNSNVIEVFRHCDTNVRQCPTSSNKSENWYYDHFLNQCWIIIISLSSPSAAYMRQWTGSSLVQVMACRLFGAKPLPEPMASHCQLGSWEQFQWNFNQNSVIFIQVNLLENVVCQNDGHFVRGRWVKTPTCRHRKHTT